jgi:hypothetical protein
MKFKIKENLKLFFSKLVFLLIMEILNYFFNLFINLNIIELILFKL